MKVVLHEGTAPANSALKTRARLKRVTVAHRRSHVGCLGLLGNPTELEEENPAEGGEMRPQPRQGQDNTATAAIWTEPHAPRESSIPVQTVYCSVCQQFQNNPCKANTPVQLHHKPHSWKAAFPNIPPPRSWDPPHAPCLQESPFPLEAISPESSEGTCPASGPQVTRDRQAQDCSTGRGCSALAATPQRMERRNVWALSNIPPAPLCSARRPCQGCRGTAAVC